MRARSRVDECARRPNPPGRVGTIRRNKEHVVTKNTWSPDEYFKNAAGPWPGPLKRASNAFPLSRPRLCPRTGKQSVFGRESRGSAEPKGIKRNRRTSARPHDSKRSQVFFLGLLLSSSVFFGWVKIWSHHPLFPGSPRAHVHTSRHAAFLADAPLPPSNPPPAKTPRACRSRRTTDRPRLRSRPRPRISASTPGASRCARPPARTRNR